LASGGRLPLRSDQAATVGLAAGLGLLVLGVEAVALAVPVVLAAVDRAAGVATTTTLLALAGRRGSVADARLELRQRHGGRVARGDRQGLQSLVGLAPQLVDDELVQSGPAHCSP